VTDVIEPVEDQQITLLLERWRAGQVDALNELMPLVYARLHALAASFMRRENPGHSLSPTAVVNEAYLRLHGKEVAWQDRAHFLAIAAREMRRVLVDHARAKRRNKRGGGWQKISLSKFDAATQEDNDLVAILSVEAALEQLTAIDPRKTAIVDLILFGGFTIPQVAEHLGISTATVNRDWRFARAFLQHELRGKHQQ
jgi:RNA polymerase sigma factor (TIGR02999 family)